MPDSTNNLPKFTIVYNTTTKEEKGWIGTAWEFFNDKVIADQRYAELGKMGFYGTLRPYSHKGDFEHLGAAHRFWHEQKT